MKIKRKPLTPEQQEELDRNWEYMCSLVYSRFSGKLVTPEEYEQEKRERQERDERFKRLIEQEENIHSWKQLDFETLNTLLMKYKLTNDEIYFNQVWDKYLKELKAALGSPGAGNQWHHIVEQAQQNASRAGFAAEEINTVENIISLQSGKDSVHSAISGLYSSKPYWTGGLTVRDWLATKSFAEQFQYGMNVLKEYGTIARDSAGSWVFKPFE